MSRDSDPPTFESLGIPQTHAIRDTFIGKVCKLLLITCVHFHIRVRCVQANYVVKHPVV